VSPKSIVFKAVFLAEFFESRKKNEILAKNADTTQKHITAVKHWSPPSFYCSALPDLRLVLFPEMSVSQPFPKGFGDE
jgi:hypothetical protein